MEWHAGMKVLYEKADAMRDMGAGWHPAGFVGSPAQYVADMMGYDLEAARDGQMARNMADVLVRSGWLDVGLGDAIVELRCDIDMDDDSWNTFVAWEIAEHMVKRVLNELYWRD